MSEWSTLRLGDAGTWLSGGTPSTSEASFWDGDIPWISASSLTNRWIEDSERRVTTLGSENGTRLVGANTILMVVRGMSLKSEFRVGLTRRQVAFGQDCKALVPRGDIDPRFLFYAIEAQKPTVLGLVDEAGHGTGRLNTNQLHDVEIGLPDEPCQQAIVDVLGALDDKIVSNNEVVDSADQLAGAMVRRHLTGHSAPLSSVAAITMGTSPKGDTMNEDGHGSPFFQGVRDFEIRFPSNRVWTTNPIRTANARDILVSVRAPVGRVNMAPQELTIGRGLAAVRSTTEHQMTLFHILKDAGAVWLPYEAVGTVFGSINRGQLHDLEVPTVDEDAQTELERDVTALEDHIAALLHENKLLAATRDALLPALMSGKLRVKDAERQVEAVV